MLNCDALKKYIENFYGYGNLDSNYWFIGIEEGATYTKEQIEEKIHGWVEKGCLEIDDCNGHYRLCRQELYKRWLDKSKEVELQTTWKQEIRVFFYATKYQEFFDNGFNENVIANYQKNKFGKLDGDMAIIELLPLPNQNVNKWAYDDIGCEVELPYLKSRKKYELHIEKDRIKWFKDKIYQCKPRNVIFVGKHYQKMAKKIIGSDIKLEIGSDKLYGKTFYYGRKN